jgi:hypothetical protein
MQVVKAGQVRVEDFLQEDFTVLLCADGYEARATAAASKLEHNHISFRYALPFKHQKVISRSNNDRFFTSSGYKFLDELDGSSVDGAYKVFDEILHPLLNSKVCRVAIDYSCMTRAWIGAFISYLFDTKATAGQVDVFFLYSPAAFSPPQYPSPNAVVAPLQGFCSLRALDMPIALIIGCGYEKMRAAGLNAYIDPAKTVLFYTDPAFDPRFPELVARNNAALFESVGEGNIIRYPLHDMDSTAALLYDAISDLSRQFRVVLAPLGVKPFSLISMLLAARYGIADVWRVSGERFAAATERKASGDLLVYAVSFNE